MTNQYSLPCPACSQTHRVGLIQAGESLTCACGATIVVPTLRELRQLAPIMDSADARAKSGGWSPQRGLLFVSGFLLLVAAGLIQWQIGSRRAALDVLRPELQEINFDIQKLTPIQSWEAWTHFRDQKLEYRETPEFVANRAKFLELSYYLKLGAALALVGIGLIVASLIWPQRRPGRASAGRGVESGRPPAEPGQA